MLVDTKLYPTIALLLKDETALEVAYTSAEPLWSAKYNESFECNGNTHRYQILQDGPDSSPRFTWVLKEKVTKYASGYSSKVKAKHGLCHFIYARENKEDKTQPLTNDVPRGEPRVSAAFNTPVVAYHDIASEPDYMSDVSQYLATIGRSLSWLRFDPGAIYDIVFVHGATVGAVTSVPQSVPDNLVAGKLWFHNATVEDQDAYNKWHNRYPVPAKFLYKLLLHNMVSDSLTVKEKTLRAWNGLLATTPEKRQLALDMLIKNASSSADKFHVYYTTKEDTWQCAYVPGDVSPDVERLTNLYRYADETKVLKSEADMNNALMHALNGNVVAPVEVNTKAELTDEEKLHNYYVNFVRQNHFAHPEDRDDPNDPRPSFEIHQYSDIDLDNNYAYYSDYCIAHQLPLPDVTINSYNGCYFVDFHGSEVEVANVPFLPKSSPLIAVGYLWCIEQEEDVQIAFLKEANANKKDDFDDDDEPFEFPDMVCSIGQDAYSLRDRLTFRENILRNGNNFGADAARAAAHNRNQHSLNGNIKNVDLKKKSQVNPNVKKTKPKKKPHANVDAMATKSLAKQVAKLTLKPKPTKMAVPLPAKANIKFMDMEEKPHMVVRHNAHVMQKHKIHSTTHKGRKKEVSHIVKAMANPLLNVKNVKRICQNLMLPDSPMGDFPTCRYSDVYSETPSAAARVINRIPASYGPCDNAVLNGSDFFAIFTRDPFCSVMYFVPNPSGLLCTYVAAIVSEQANNGPNALPSIPTRNASSYLSGSSINVTGSRWVPICYMVPGTNSVLNAHGNYLYPKRAASGANYIFLGVGHSFYYGSLAANGTSYSYYYSVYYDNCGVDISVSQGTITVPTSGTGVSTFTATVPGYYAVKLYTNTSAGIYGQFFFEVNNGSKSLVAHRSLPNLENRLQTMIGVRTNGFSGMVSNFTNIQTAQGSMACAVVPGNRSWVELLDSKDGTKINAISTTKIISQTQDDNGIRAWCMPASDADFAINMNYSVKPLGIEGAFAQLYSQSNYIVAYFSNYNGSQGALELFDAKWVEWFSEDPWTELELSNYTPEEWIEAMQIAKSVEKITANPIHFLTIAKGILSGLEKYAGTVGNAVSRIAGAINGAI